MADLTKLNASILALTAAVDGATKAIAASTDDSAGVAAAAAAVDAQTARLVAAVSPPAP